ncbi:MAG TPA: efflux RND transporter periplasmic adaptor subunit [Burkholderiales bacterium]|nr:efflux RND transporter periplasmic adaptor subunit [Burkholderiales bacterium]
MKRIFSIARLAAVVSAAAALSACAPKQEHAEEVRPVTTVQVAPANGEQEVRYTGDVRARYETALGFRVPGKIVVREVEVGSSVKRGQLLARLDPSDFRLNIEAARSQLAAAQADFLQAKDDLARYRNLHEQKFVSAAEFDRRQNAHNVAKARLEQAQAQLGVTQNQSAYTTLRADDDGIITAITAEVGQVVSAGQEVMRLARLEEKEVVISVPESRLGELDAAREVTITLWAQPDVKFAGRIREISPSADPVTRTYTVKVTLLQPGAEVQLGMTANVLLGTESAQPIIRLPLTALYQQGEKPAVWIIDPKTSAVVLTPVEVARYTQEAVEISSGLKTGDVVVRAGVHKLTAGQKVRVLAAPDAS